MVETPRRQHMTATHGATGADARASLRSRCKRNCKLGSGDERITALPRIVPVRTRPIAWRRPVTRRLRAFALMAAAVAIATLASPTAALARGPGDLDPSFGRDGVAYIDFGGVDRGRNLFADSSGRLLVSGETGPDYPSCDERPVLGRLLRQGELDHSFGDGGRRILRPVESGFVDAWSPTADGNVVLVGSHPSCKRDNALYLAAYRSTGRIDRSFGENGVVSGRIRRDGPFPLDVLVLPSGRILVLFWNNNGSVVKAFRSDGSVARSFGSGGRLEIPRFTGEALASAPDGRVLIAGEQWSRSGRAVLAVHAVDESGHVDTSFGSNGRAQIELAPAGGEFLSVGGNALKVFNDGTIAVGGSVGPFFDAGAFVARFTADGRPLASFGGGDGFRTFGIRDASVGGLVELPGGRIAVVGSVLRYFTDDDPQFVSSDVLVLALESDGSFWRTFANNGRFRTHFGHWRWDVTGRDAAVVDGRLVVIGSGNGNGVSSGDVMVVRFLLN